MTYTILATDAGHRWMGVATASFSLAVGAGVPALRVGVGAVASQAYTNRALRAHALDALAAGQDPADILAGLPAIDPGAAKRQVAVLTPNGTGQAHTGAECSDWAGHRTAENLVAAGNLLAGPGVLDAMIEACVSAQTGNAAPDPGPQALARALVAALAAGEAAGGDRRGRQSVALLVGRTDSIAEHEPLAVDLRVDDHPDPVRELTRLLDLAGAA